MSRSASGTPFRTRFAPSPTGELHLGGARTALFCFLLARKHHGAFVIRIEDTDQDRSKETFIQTIHRDLEWLGLHADEGDSQGGGFGPYRQSQRQVLYQERLTRLLKDQAVYPCFCSKDRLALLRKEQERQKLPPRYDGLCAQLASMEVSQRLARKEPHTIRFRIPHEKQAEIVFEDLIHGSLRFKTRDLEDFIVVREDGTFPFLMPSLVDDLEMKISHVLRGDDHLANTPKQILLATALGQTAPTYGHLPLVLGEDGHALSKRLGDLGIAALRAQGFLPQAITQAMLLLGWSPSTAQDPNLAWTTAQQIDYFSTDRVHRSPARLDLARMRAINRAHLQTLHSDDLAGRLRDVLQVQAAPSAAEKEALALLDSGKSGRPEPRGVLLLLRAEVDQLTALAEPWLDILHGPKTLPPEDAKNLSAILILLEKNPAVQSLNQLADVTKAQKGPSGRDFFHPLRLALTGRETGPKVAELFDLFGREGVLDRLRQILQKQ